jgi:hypothetical protein
VSEASSQLLKADSRARTIPQSSEPKQDSDASRPATSAGEKPVKKRRKRTIKTVAAEGDCPTPTAEQSNEETKPKREKEPKVKKKGMASLRPGEVLPEVPAGELPPLHLWRKFFPTEKASLHRCAVRNPETAAMLADIFVPEGSKDKIIIEASPGVSTFPIPLIPRA